MDGEIILSPLYVFIEEGSDEKGRVVGKLVKQENLIHREKLINAGILSE